MPYRPPTRAALLVRRIVRATLQAVNMKIVHLIFFRAHQECAAVAAGIINRMIAGLEHRRGTDNRPYCRRGNNLESDYAIFAHHSPLHTCGSATTLSHPVPTVRPVEPGS